VHDLLKFHERITQRFIGLMGRKLNLYHGNDHAPTGSVHAGRAGSVSVSVFEVGVGFRFFGYLFKSVSVSAVYKTSVIGFGFGFVLGQYTDVNLLCSLACFSLFVVIIYLDYISFRVLVSGA